MLSISPKLNLKYITPSTMHKNHTGVVAGHLDPLGNEVILFLPEHSGNGTPMRGDVLNPTGHLKVPEGATTDSEVMSPLWKHSC